MTGDEQEAEMKAQADAMRRAQVEPMTCALVLGYLAAGVGVAGLVIGALWLMAWAG